MIGYLLSYDNIAFNDGFGQNRIALRRSVSPARARILGGAFYDLDGMYTYPAEQTYTAEFADRNGEFIAKPLHRRLGTFGWMRATSRQLTNTNLVNWAKLVAIDASATPNDWMDPSSQRNIYTLTFQCSPFWYDESDSTIQINATGFGFTNTGNARSTYWQLNIQSAITNPLVITIRRDTGPVYGVAIYGQQQYTAFDSQSITYAAAKTAGVVLTLDARSNTARLSSGANAYSNITLPSTQPNFGYFWPTANRIAFNQNVVGSLTYRGAYV